jgi:transcriptional regulator of acetoin/glycerol metabolism
LLRATLNSSGMRLTVDDFPPLLGADNVAHHDRTAPSPRPSDPSTGSNDSDEVVQTLRACGGSVSKAAKVLGIHRATLYRRLEKLGIQAS